MIKTSKQFPICPYQTLNINSAGKLFNRISNLHISNLQFTVKEKAKEKRSKY